MNNAFKPADILVPKKSVDMNNWSVIACDQYTSEPEYWKQTSKIVGQNYSSLNLILPEIYLEDENVKEKIENIHKNIQKRLALCYNGLEQYNFLLEQRAPSKILQQYSSRLQQVQQAIQAQQKTRMNDKNMQFQHAAALAASLDPYRVLARGYALVTDTKGKVCTVEQLQPEQTICVRSRQYQARCRVETVEEINESTQKL